MPVSVENDFNHIKALLSVMMV